MKKINFIVLVGLLVLQSCFLIGRRNRRFHATTVDSQICSNGYYATADGCIPEDSCNAILDKGDDCSTFPSCCGDGLVCTDGTCSVAESGYMTVTKSKSLYEGKTKVVLSVSLTGRHKVYYTDNGDEPSCGSGSLYDAYDKPSVLSETDRIVTKTFKFVECDNNQPIATVTEEVVAVPPVSSITVSDVDDGSCSVNIVAPAGKIQYSVLGNGDGHDVGVGVGVGHGVVTSVESVTTIEEGKYVKAWVEAGDHTSAVKRSAVCGGGDDDDDDSCDNDSDCNAGKYCSGSGNCQNVPTPTLTLFSSNNGQCTITIGNRLSGHCTYRVDTASGQHGSVHSPCPSSKPVNKNETLVVSNNDGKGHYKTETYKCTISSNGTCSPTTDNVSFNITTSSSQYNVTGNLSGLSACSGYSVKMKVKAFSTAGDPQTQTYTYSLNGNGSSSFQEKISCYGDDPNDSDMAEFTLYLAKSGSDNIVLKRALADCGGGVCYDVPSPTINVDSSSLKFSISSNYSFPSDGCYIGYAYKLDNGNVTDTNSDVHISYASHCESPNDTVKITAGWRRDREPLGFHYTSTKNAPCTGYCSDSGDCGDNEICNMSTHTCQTCQAPTPHKYENQCVECLSDTQCVTGKICNNHMCINGERSCSCDDNGQVSYNNCGDGRQGSCTPVNGQYGVIYTCECDVQQ